MDDRVKIGYRISEEAQKKLKMGAVEAELTIEQCLDYLILNGKYPPVEFGRKKSLENS